MEHSDNASETAPVGEGGSPDMPKLTFECPRHGEFELIVRPSDHEDHPRCPHARCKATTVQTYHSAKPKDWAILPVVIHLGKDGSVRFPGDSACKVPRGFERIEFRTIREIAEFEKKMNAKFSSEAEEHHANEEKFFAPLRAQLRSELRQAMQHMSPLGRDFARAAMKANDNKPQKSNDTGFHLQILHFDAANRDAYRPGRGFKPCRWV